jgi:hypothetical protein
VITEHLLEATRAHLLEGANAIHAALGWLGDAAGGMAALWWLMKLAIDPSGVRRSVLGGLKKA